MSGIEEFVLSGGARSLDQVQAPHFKQYGMRNFSSSLKQWRMLHALIDCGSYAEAAERLHVSQSTLSYTILQLQERLGVQLLKLEGRKAVLTEAGAALLERSRRVLDEARALEEFARNFEQ